MDFHGLGGVVELDDNDGYWRARFPSRTAVYMARTRQAAMDRAFRCEYPDEYAVHKLVADDFPKPAKRKRTAAWSAVPFLAGKKKQKDSACVTADGR